jgi:hypothetical protein
VHVVVLAVRHVADDGTNEVDHGFFPLDSTGVTPTTIESLASSFALAVALGNKGTGLGLPMAKG